MPRLVLAHEVYTIGAERGLSKTTIWRAARDRNVVIEGKGRAAKWRLPIVSEEEESFPGRMYTGETNMTEGETIAPEAEDAKWWSRSQALRVVQARPAFVSMSRTIVQPPGYRVLVIDFDIQNSLSFDYLDEVSVADRKNLALALNSRDLMANILTSNYFGIDILASSFSLTNLRTIGANTLQRMIAKSKPAYDFILIDCAPSYDDPVQNAICASDLILTPVRLSQFDLEGASFYRNQIAHT